MSWKKAKKGNLKLMKFFLTEKNLRKALNGKANGAFKGLVKEGNDGRIVSEIWVVVEASFSEEIRKAGGFTASYNDGTLELRGRAKSSSTHKNTIKLAPGTTFAYLMHKVKKWNKKGNKVASLTWKTTSLECANHSSPWGPHALGGPPRPVRQTRATSAHLLKNRRPYT